MDTKITLRQQLGEKRKKLVQELTLKRIKKQLREKQYSIADLSRAVGIERSTLIYYLNILEKQGWITKKRILEKKKGRPTLIKFNSKREKKQVDSFIKDKIKILKLISKHATRDKIIEEFGVAAGVGFLSSLETEGLVKENYELTAEGKQFLKENTKN